MRIFVTGGSGFVGRYLVPRLGEAGHELCLLLRPGRPAPPPAGPALEVVAGDPLRAGPWWSALQDCDAAVNLVGEPVHGRWTSRKRTLLRDSRLMPLRHLVAALPTDRPFVLLSASAVGYYGDAGEQVLTEDSPPGSDFLARLARDWERLALRAAGPDRRVVITRLGAVLGAGGGGLAEMIRALRRGTGAVLGSGRQWFSWIHQEDLARAVLHLLEDGAAEGAYNLGSPHPMRQAEVARTLAALLRRPVGRAIPAAALRLTLGGFAEALLASQRMVPRRLLEAGFEFGHPELEPALREVLGRDGG